MTLRARIRNLLGRVQLGWVDASEDFEQIVRDIVREEIAAANASERERRQQMLADIRAGKPVDAFVNYGVNPHGNPEQETEK